MAPRPLLIVVRGPIGAGKTTLMHGLVRSRGRGWWALNADAANDFHPSDPHGEHLDTEWNPEVDILGLHARMILGRGLNLVVDSGDFITRDKLDRFLRRVGRSRRDRRVILIRLTVPTDEAVRRKTTVRPEYVRASHSGWISRPIRGELVVETAGKTARQVLRETTAAIEGLSVVEGTESVAGPGRARGARSPGPTGYPWGRKRLTDPRADSRSER